MSIAKLKEIANKNRFWIIVAILGAVGLYVSNTNLGHQLTTTFNPPSANMIVEQPPAWATKLGDGMDSIKAGMEAIVAKLTAPQATPTASPTPATPVEDPAIIALKQEIARLKADHGQQAPVIGPMPTAPVEDPAIAALKQQLAEIQVQLRQTAPAPSRDQQIANLYRGTSTNPDHRQPNEDMGNDGQESEGPHGRGGHEQGGLSGQGEQGLAERMARRAANLLGNTGRKPGESHFGFQGAQAKHQELPADNCRERRVPDYQTRQWVVRVTCDRSPNQQGRPR